MKPESGYRSMRTVDFSLISSTPLRSLCTFGLGAALPAGVSLLSSSSMPWPLIMVGSGRDDLSRSVT